MSGPFNAGDQVTLTADHVQWRDGGRTEVDTDDLYGGRRGRAAVVTDATPDSDGDIGIHWADRPDDMEMAVDPAVLQHAVAAELVDARVAAELTTRKLRELAAIAAARIDELQDSLADWSGHNYKSETVKLFEGLLEDLTAGDGVHELANIERELEK